MEKAQQRAQQILKTQSLKQQLSQAKSAAKSAKQNAKSTASDAISAATLTDHDVQSQHLTALKETYLSDVAKRKGQLALALAPVKDATVKAQLHAAALADLAKMAADYAGQISTAKQGQANQLQAAKSVAGSTQDASDSSADSNADSTVDSILNQLAQTSASGIVLTAEETARVKMLP